MPTIKLSVPHNLGVEEAQRRIVRLIGETKARYGEQVTEVRETWAGNKSDFSFKAMGFSVSGNLEVEPTLVKGELNLPFAALPFKNRIESDLSTKARELLA